MCESHLAADAWLTSARNDEGAALDLMAKGLNNLTLCHGSIEDGHVGMFQRYRKA